MPFYEEYWTAKVAVLSTHWEPLYVDRKKNCVDLDLILKEILKIHIKSLFTIT